MTPTTPEGQEPKEGFCTCGRSRNDQCWQCTNIRDGHEPNDTVGQALRAASAALDDLMVLANREETRAALCEEARGLGQLLTRAELLCSFALAVKPAPTHIRRVS